ncbi:MAG TPA: U32 family peptidase [Verrucomicrobiae bacterium]|nr:U32 family peptidase [Verrucomicrobiae bacterium]
MGHEGLGEARGAVELLAPAKDAECGRAAILCGADAVYIGGPRFGARGRAGNSVEAIEGLAAFAHVYRARVFVAINTILSDSELSQAVELIWAVHGAGVDGVIIQDMGLLECELPPLPLIASTQTHNMTAEKVLFLERAGFSRVILERELTLEEIREIRSTTEVPLECFVHGALCVCQSGQCFLSYAIGGRSGNRGDCAQPCRRQYSLLDGSGRVLVSERHLLSLKDLNLTPDIGGLLDAGVRSFKIEGRLKDAGYVKNVVSHYRRTVDAALALRPGLRRASFGESEIEFEPDPAKSFNRGFTPYFLHGRHRGIGSIETPKSVGATVGTVAAIDARGVRIEGDALRPGDGIAFFDGAGQLHGTSVEGVEGDRVRLADASGISPRVVVHRNLDREFENRLARGRIARRVAIDIRLRHGGSRPYLEARDPEGIRCAVEMPAADLSRPKDPVAMAGVWRQQLGKLGGTEFGAREIVLECDEVPFVPAGKIAAWRRELVAKLRAARAAAFMPARAEAPKGTSHPCPGREMGFEANVMNAKARAFYERHGALVTEPAAETGEVDLAGRRVMTTRHCIRYELGQCPRESGGGTTEDLWLVDDRGRRFRLTFDCAGCHMEVWLETAEGRTRAADGP